MNEIILHGIIKDIQFSHFCNNIEFYKANLITRRENSEKEDILTLKFKRFSNPYKEGDEIDLIGNIRTYSSQENGKSKVDMYVFTYFDSPKEEDAKANRLKIDGRVCKINTIKKTQTGKDVIDFILANNLKTESGNLNCYLPCVAWGKIAKQLKEIKVGDLLDIEGCLQSREYKKKTTDNDFEFRIAHEIVLKKVEIK